MCDRLLYNTQHHVHYLLIQTVINNVHAMVWYGYMHLYAYVMYRRVLCTKSIEKMYMSGAEVSWGIPNTKGVEGPILKGVSPFFKWGIGFSNAGNTS